MRVPQLVGDELELQQLLIDHEVLALRVDLHFGVVVLVLYAVA